MKYSYVRLQNYRSYDDYSIELQPGVNIVVGPNASGKTNLLEALYVLSTGKSFRVKDEDLIRINKGWARLDALVDGKSRVVKINKKNTGTVKEFSVDGVAQKKRAINRITIPTTLFEPQDLQLFSSPPESRRVYLDNIIEQMSDNFSATRRQYKRALFQRNRLLKQSANLRGEELFAWDIQLSKLGAIIVHERRRLIEEINKQATNLYKSISSKKASLRLYYVQSIDSKDYSSSMLHELQKNTPKDTERGFTSVGPHRDDVVAYLNDKDVSTSASRGEIRTILLVLKIVELSLLEKKTNIQPLLLLDDVFSELDGARRQALTGYLQKYQTVITTTDADAILEHFLNEASIIPIG